MKCSFEEYALRFNRPFGLSQNMREYTDCLLVQLKHNNFTGFGEATLPPYLEETLNSTKEFIEKFKTKHLTTLPSIEEFNAILNSIDRNHYSAKAALDIAFHDLIGKIEKKTISELYNIRFHPKKSSFTIGLDSPSIMIEKIEEAYQLGFDFLKLKMGTNNDFELFQSISNHIKSNFSIDANQGWLNKSEALELCNMFHNYGAVYIEQPFEKRNLKDSNWLTNRSPIPIIADESCKTINDLDRIKDSFHGVNIKLMKCGGLYNAHIMFELAKKYKLKTIAGCMAESSCGVAAMNHLASFADWIDLDAPMLIKNDPFEKIKYDGGKIITTKKYGIGVEKLT